MDMNMDNILIFFGGYMIAVLVPNVVSLTSSLDCLYSFQYF